MKWLALAEKVPLGSKTRHPCVNECGTDKSMLVSHTARGYFAYCFRCGSLGFKHKGYQSLDQLKAIADMNRIAKEQAIDLELPKDLVYDVAEWPSEARMWLYKASIYGNTIEEHNIAYSPSSGRVCIPVYAEGELVFYQLRRIYGDGPKYLGPAVNRETVLFWSLPDEYDMSRVVVVEDMLSAIRIGKFIPCACILGTKLSIQQAEALSHFNCVITWLDPDNAGVEGASAIRRTMSLICTTYNIVSSKDPKNLSNSELKEVLYNDI